MAGGPFKLNSGDEGLMVFVEGPGYSKGFFNIPDDIRLAEILRDTLNNAYMAGYNDGYSDGAE